MRRFAAVAIALCAGLAPAAAVDVRPPRAAAEDPPRTGFEERDGATWTTHEEELAFLAKVDAGSPYAAVDVIGTTAGGRPIHLVRIGVPAPPTAAQARSRPVELHVCSQHGNEPAGREACLMVLRDLAFTTDAATLAQLRAQTVLFVPSANPDGRESNARTNSEGVDINRDHLNLASAEAKAMAQVVRDWQPEIAIDHHEYGPGTPVLYDDEVLYLWPRNLNVDAQVHDLAVEFSKHVLAPCLEDAGYTSDEYGVDALLATDVQQTAGGGDEGIMRNAAGLRHVVGILVESAVTLNPTNGPDEATTAGQQRRRVASQVATLRCTLAYMGENGAAVAAATAGAAERAVVEGRTGSRPVYFAGQDEDTTVLQNGDEEVSVEAPCGYDLDAEQLRVVRPILDLHGIVAVPRGNGARVTMAQPAEPVIPLLLDERNTDRAETDATPLSTCGAAGPPPGRPPGGGPGGPGGPGGGPGGPGAVPGGIPATGGSGVVAVAAVLAAAGAALLRRAVPGR